MAAVHEENQQTAYAPELDARPEEAISKQDLARCKTVLGEIQTTLQAFSTSSIAEQVGIEDLSYFYRLFKKAFGATPKEYREIKQGP